MAIEVNKFKSEVKEALDCATGLSPCTAKVLRMRWIDGRYGLLIAFQMNEELPDRLFKLAKEIESLYDYEEACNELSN